jgi:hypothetical protein
MPNRQLTAQELENVAGPLLVEIRERLRVLAAGDDTLLWALRRKLFKELMYDERGTPMQRAALKKAKRADQDGLCALCHQPLPIKGSILDRLEAMGGYTPDNTRLLCARCDTRVQTGRDYK